MLRILYAVLVGLLCAGIVHIAILLLLPSVSDRDAWSRLAAAEPQSFVRLGEEAGVAGLLTSADPHFEAAVCRFDLSQSFTHVQADGEAPFWSISVYNRAGQNVYSFNDRTAADGVLDLVVATPVQATALRRSPPTELEQAILVELTGEEGMVVLRVFVPDESWRPQVNEYLAGAQCAAEG